MARFDSEIEPSEEQRAYSTAALAAAMRGAAGMISPTSGSPGAAAIAGIRSLLPGGGSFGEESQRYNDAAAPGIYSKPSVMDSRVAGMHAPAVDDVMAQAGPLIMSGMSPKEYGGTHRPPKPEGGAPLHDLTGGGAVYPEDVYGPKAAQFYGHFGGNDPMDVQTVKLAQQLRGKPDAEVTIYRAVPKGVDASEINPGDWVTINRKYAESHGERFDEGATILAKKVRAKDLFTNGDSIHEFGFWPAGEKAAPPSPARSGPVRATDEQFRALNEQLRAAHPDVDFSLTGGAGGAVVLDRIVVPKEARGQGVGSAFMDDLVKQADANGLTLALSPSADFGGTPSRIREWNKRFGFVDNKGRTRDLELSESMYRRPTPAETVPTEAMAKAVRKKKGSP